MAPIWKWTHSGKVAPERNGFVFGVAHWGLAAGGTLRPRALDPGGAELGVTNSIVTHLLRLTAAAKPSPDLLPSAFSANNGAGAGKAASRLQSLHLRPLLCSSAASEPGK